MFNSIKQHQTTKMYRRQLINTIQTNINRNLLHNRTIQSIICNTTIIKYNTKCLYNNNIYNQQQPYRLFSAKVPDPLPELTDEQKQIEQDKITKFLSSINNDYTQYADKFTTYDELLNMPSIYMKLRHQIPSLARRQIRKAATRLIHKQNVINQINYTQNLRKAERMLELVKANRDIHDMQQLEELYNKTIAETINQSEQQPQQIQQNTS